MDLIAEDLISIIPLIHKGLMKPKECGSGKDIFRAHFEVMFMLEKMDALPISEIGKRLSLSKPHMTALVDKLIADGFLERRPDNDDRRIIRLSLTAEGRDFIRAFKEGAKENIKRKLSILGDGDLETLSISLQNIKSIVGKISLEGI